MREAEGSAAARAHWVGVDIGGTRIKAVALTRDGTRLAEATTPTPVGIAADVRGAVRDALVGLLAAAGSKQPPAGLGVVVPGIVDDERGIAVDAVNLGWRDLDLRAAVDGLADRIAVGHDVRAGLLGEHHWGAARDIQDVLFVAIGTGLASGLMLRGRLATGSAWAGEIGHVRVGQADDPCGCGRVGCLESIAAARGITRRWAAAGGSGDVRELLVAAAAGNTRAVAIWQDAIEALAAVLAPVAAATGVSTLVLGGGVSRAGAALTEPLQAALRDRLLPPGVPQLRLAALGDLAGALGAAALAMEARA